MVLLSQRYKSFKRAQTTLVWEQVYCCVRECLCRTSHSNLYFISSMLLYQLLYKESMWTQPRGFPLIFVQSRNKKLNWEFTCSDLWHRKGQALVYLDALWSEITASMGGKTSSILYIPLHNGFLWILLRGKFVTEGPMCQYFLFASVRDRISLTINFLTKGLGNPFRQLCTISQCPIVYMSMYNIFKHF